MDPDCLFCKIIVGDVESEKVAETDLAYAFGDVNPQAPTHVLVVPKVHQRDVGSLVAADPAAMTAVLELARDVADGQPYRLVFNTGAEAGQSVFHCHAHVLAGRSFGWPPG